MSGSHQSPAASADPVSAWTTRTCGATPGPGPSCRYATVRAGSVVPSIELERAERDRFEAAGAGRKTGRLDRVRWRHAASSRPRPEPDRHPATPTSSPSAGLSAVAASSAWSRSAMRSSTCSSPTDRRTRSSVVPVDDLLLWRQLGVGRRGRVDDQRLGVADVGEQREDLDVVDEPTAGLDAALDPEGDDATEATGQVTLGELVGRVRLETRIADPGHLGSALEPLGHRQRVLAVALDPQRQRLEALQEQERVERAERRADVAEALDAELEDEREVPEGGGVRDPVVRRIRIDEVGLEPLADAAQSKVPPSTTTPPMAVPWPPIHFVAEWMTMSAPCLIGWASSGANVLSTMTGTPRACATSAIEARSWTSSRGLPMSSRKTALVFSSIARPNADGSVPST